MTAKTYTQLISQANATLADNVSRDISAGDSRNMAIDHLDSQNAGTLVVVVEQGTLPSPGQLGRLFFRTAFTALYIDDGTSFVPVVMTFNSRLGPNIIPTTGDYSINQLSDVTVTVPIDDDILVSQSGVWVNQSRQWIENITNDWVPKIAGLGIGSTNASPAFVAVGDVAADGLEGIIAQRTDADGGGMTVVGFRGDPTGAVEANAPVELRGSSIILDGGAILMQVPNAVAEEHFLITQPSFALPDGRIVVPIVLGPVYTPANEESDTSVLNVAITPAATEIDILGGTEGAGLVLGLSHPIGSTLSVFLTIEETAGNSADVTITVKRDPTGGGSPVPIFTDSISLSGNRQNYIASGTTTITMNITDVLSVHVEFVNGAGGGTRTVNVRGDIFQSEISIRD